MTRGKYVVPEKKSKYKAVRCEVDGIKFDSKKEAKRYGELKMMEKAGLISDLKFQPVYELRVNGVKVCKYIGDFEYNEYVNGLPLLKVEDVKSEHTRKLPVYRLKKRLMKACLNIDITEV